MEKDCGELGCLRTCPFQATGGDKEQQRTLLCSCGVVVAASDLAENNLEGNMPAEWGNLKEIHTLKLNGRDVEFVKVLFILKCIDLSNNFLSGSIPPKMGYLQGLIALNLSRNHLSGGIPGTLGRMDQLEIFAARLNESIPLELELLSYLEFLNLSYNMLDGKVPHGWQFLMFGESSYLGNHKLSGIPFTNTTVCNNSSVYSNRTSIETIGEAKE
ncbi:putative receptor like protein 25 [Cryptomeria japonica]|uniref:putative receptor like protein 25 n=1 Tax=Cryptomeria japonica TaxID=3369 RepID=UPI0025ABBF1E|nr:putative receptor like protein 25 [Cryptomeria japonica]